MSVVPCKFASKNLLSYRLLLSPMRSKWPATPLSASLPGICCVSLCNRLSVNRLSVRIGLTVLCNSSKQSVSEGEPLINRSIVETTVTQFLVDTLVDSGHVLQPEQQRLLHRDVVFFLHFSFCSCVFILWLWLALQGHCKLVLILLLYRGVARTNKKLFLKAALY